LIRAGVGGWTYAPWRDNFYPKGLAQKRELEYASRKLTSIEINGTFYRSATPASFAKWRDETPDDFVFSVKASRYATHRTVLAEARDPIERFLGSGLAELGTKLGPILWQFPTSKRFDAEDFEHFLALLPATLNGRPLRHALDVRHESFRAPAFVTLAARYGAAVVYSDTDKFPSIADVTADFVYARLMRAEASEPAGYPAAALARWVERSRDWADRGRRDVFVYFINGAKERAPAAACALLEHLKKG